MHPVHRADELIQRVFAFGVIDGVCRCHTANYQNYFSALRI